MSPITLVPNIFEYENPLTLQTQFEALPFLFSPLGSRKERPKRSVTAWIFSYDTPLPVEIQRTFNLEMFPTLPSYETGNRVVSKPSIVKRELVSLKCPRRYS
jgi:hypothetical protein